MTKGFSPNEVNKMVLSMMTEYGPDWKKPWVDLNAGLPVNALTNKPYSGINIFILISRQKPSRYWGTYRQWEKLGAQVRKGEKGTHIVFWKTIVKQVDGEDDPQVIPMLRTYTVFNATQVDDWEEPAPDVPLYETVGSAVIDGIYTALNVNVEYGGDVAAFWPRSDRVTIPLPEQFVSADAFDSTRLHELTHWAGGEERLDRDMSGKFGDDKYAFEELVAEMGSVYLCMLLGVSPEPRPDHARYLANWMKGISDDTWMFYHACQKAEKAFKYICEGAGIDTSVVVVDEEMVAA